MRLLALFIYILAELQSDGSAVVTENWDIDTVNGTEIYLVRENLGDITISDFSVSEDGTRFIFESDWDTGRSMEDKAGRCGIIQKQDGYELCWGIGSHGHHNFTASYRMSNAVKSLTDYDKLHLQLVSPGITPLPDSVSVHITAPVKLSVDNTRLWGFGFEGKSGFCDDGSIFFESTEAFRRKSCVIVLLRFDKGIFNSKSIIDHSFDTDLETALEGASFRDDEEVEEGSIWDFLKPILAFFAFIAAIIAGEILSKKKIKERILGCREKEIGWYRDIPCGGDVLEADYILERLGENNRNTVASALILRMINKGIINVSHDKFGNVEMSFNPSADLDLMGKSERTLYNMMIEAGGRDRILQKNEFKRWSGMHSSRIESWASRVNDEGMASLASSGKLKGKAFTASGQECARNLIGFRKYLKDFTLLDERYSNEVGVWHDMLIFAALFGIAEKVAAELREINPKAFEETFNGDFDTTCRTLRQVRVMADSITNARAAGNMSGMSRGGFGGFTSIGGGGGFSGGGHGGGVR